MPKPFENLKNLSLFNKSWGWMILFLMVKQKGYPTPYRTHAWVNIAVSTLMRNTGRASFQITRDGEFVTSGQVFELFRDVNPVVNRFDLLKVTSAWWFLEGEAFWFFDDNYKAGIPRGIM